MASGLGSQPLAWPFSNHLAHYVLGTVEEASRKHLGGAGSSFLEGAIVKAGEQYSDPM